MSPSEVETLQGAVEEGAHAAEAAEGSGNVGLEIVGHVMDSRDFHIGPKHFELGPEIKLFGDLIDLSITKHVLMMWLAAAFLLIVLIGAARSARSPVPGRLRNLIEIFMMFIRDEVARKTIPHHADRYVGYLLTTFFFILTCNLLGLVPFMATATGNISVTAALALMAFIQIQWGGIREHGLFAHLRHLAPGGIPLWLVPLMVVVEFLGMLVKPFALCIRLFANMMAGHVVILAFISLIFILNDMWGLMAGVAAVPFAVGFALFIHVLELLIAFIQAYIFTVLTSTFIGMSINPAH